MLPIPIPEELSSLSSALQELARPCASFELQKTKNCPAGSSKLGGCPDLPEGFDWPVSRGRKLDFLLQVRLRDLNSLPGTGALPRDGVLSFFYDLDKQPWGFDPAQLSGFRVVYFRESTPLRKHPIPNAEFGLDECRIEFRPGCTLPNHGCRAYERLNLSDEMADVYSDYIKALANHGRSGSPPQHRLLGHAENIQGDMQLEAQLVTNGLYCGNPSGYNDPRRKLLEKGADDWMLLLQLDSDEDAGNFMWGDCGMLYYWIRAQDLMECRFDRVWMTLQCC